MTVLRRIGTGVAATVAVSSSATAATGDRAGLALLNRVHRAYAQVPAVTVSGKTGQLGFRWTVVLVPPGPGPTGCRSRAARPRTWRAW